MPKWTKADWNRFWLHLPVGAIMAWLTSQDTALGIMSVALFCFYEYMNDWRKVDSSYKDVIGAVFGFIIVASVISLWRIL